MTDEVQFIEGADEEREKVLAEIEALPERNEDNLFAALQKAQSSIKAILRDADHDKFGRYTSAENMIAVARAVLNKHGLAVVPAGDEIQIAEGSRFKVNKYVLGHVSGESIQGSFTIPIETVVSSKTGKESSVQDATLKADTIALSYYLRNVLQLPRYDEDRHLAGAKPKAYYDEPKRKLISPEQMERLDDLMKATGANHEAVLAKYGVKSTDQLTEAAYNDMVKMLEHRIKATAVADQFGPDAVVTKTEVLEEEALVSPSQVTALIDYFAKRDLSVHECLDDIGHPGNHDVDVIERLVMLPVSKLMDVKEWIKSKTS